MPDWRLGTIGFGYSDWHGVFYPPGTKSADYLSFYAQHFDTLELDTTFHAAPTRQRVRRWAEATPPHFRFCVKTPKNITHAPPPLQARLAAMHDFLGVIRDFDDKLGVVLLQFPPGFDAGSRGELEKLLAALPGDLRYAVELRHASWNTDPTASMLRDHRCCWAAGDYFGDPWPLHVTTDFLYIRWIGEHGRFPTLDREQLDTADRLAWWKQQIEAASGSLKTIWGLMNNDYSGYAVAATNKMKQLVGLPIRIGDPPQQGQLFG